MRFRWWVWLLLSVLAGGVFADGKFYAPGTPPPGIPYQRALIVFDGAREVLLVQSQKPEAAATLGWVVPVPAVPELGTLDAELAEKTFMRLRTEVTSYRTRFPFFVLALAIGFLFSFAWMARQDYPAYRRDGRRPALARYLPTLYYLLPILLLLVWLPPGSRVTPEEEQMVVQSAALFLVLSFFGGLLGWFLHLLEPSWRDSALRPALVTIFALAFLIEVAMVLLVPVMLGRGFGKSADGAAPAAAPARVEVVRQAAFGDLDVKVIAATAAGDGAAVVDWLNANGFAFVPDDVAAFERHVRRGGVFAVARVSPGGAAAAPGNSALTPPLLLRFPTGKLIYPLALTATGGARTTVELFTLTPWPLAPSDGAPRRYSDPLAGIGSAGELLAGAQTTGWLDREAWTEEWVSHYRLDLYPEAMTDDLVLEKQSQRDGGKKSPRNE